MVYYFEGSKVDKRVIREYRKYIYKIQVGQRFVILQLK